MAIGKNINITYISMTVKYLSIISLICIICFQTSCKQSTYTKVFTFEQHKVPNKPLEFIFENPHANKTFDVTLKLTHTPHIKHNQFVFDFAIGNNFSTTLGVVLRNRDGNFKGVKQGDSIVLKQSLLQNQLLPQGRNTFLITPAMNVDTVYHISAIELQIKEAE
jgi:hypothetical protein